MLGHLLPLRRLLSSRGILRSVRCIPLQDPNLLDHPECDSGARVKVRDFSSRPAARPRNGSAPRQQWKGDFNSRGPGDQRRGGSRAAAAGRSKSLIDDEAELSDWVSDLKKDSISIRLSSDDEDGPDRDRTRSSRGRGRERGGGRDRNPPAYVRRQNDSDSDDFSDGPERRKLRGGRTGGSFSRRRDHGDPEDEVFSRRPGRGWGGRGMISSSSARRGGRGFDSSSRPSLSEDEEDEGSERRGRGRGIGGISSNSNLRQGRGTKIPVLASSEDDEDDDDDDDISLSGFDDDSISDSDEERKGDDSIRDSDEERKGDVKDTFKSDDSYRPAEGDSVQAAARTSIEENDSYLSQTRFDQCSLSPLSLKGLKSIGYERMTIVQEATLPAILKGKDVLAKAKTGTGKTVAFLLPSIEVVAKLPSVDRDNKKPPISVLVVCPTRELAAQANAEAETLLKYHPSIGCQFITGGTRLALEQKRMLANPCQILVATPGRLRDHIENTPGFATRLMGVKVLVLDEADRLLDMGFRKDIEKIVAAVPRQRQTLLFSATVPEEVRQVCYIALKRDHEFVNTVEEGSEETHSQVKQMHLVAPLEKQFSLLYSILTDHVSEDVDYKVIIFCTTAMVTKLVADLLSELKLNVREIHSRKPQTYRTRVSKEFRESKGLILVSSDVSARGVDYPNVTLVVQVGVPADREQYIHRLGRTGRRGKEGKGILMLAPWEEFFLDSINNLPITKAPLPIVDPDTRKKVERALAHVEMKNKESAYQAWLGYYNSNKNVGRDKCKLVLLANEFSRSLGLDNPPAIPKLVLRKMGLNNVPGLRSK